MQRIGRIVPGELQHRQQQLALGMHRHRERRDDGLDLVERHAALARTLIQLADDVRLLRQPVRDATTLRVTLLSLALRRRFHAHYPPAHAAPRLQGVAGATPAEKSRHEVVEECVERLARHGRIEFHALHPDVGEAGRPLPPLELVQRAAVAHHRFPEKREGPRLVGHERAQALEGGIGGSDAGRMPGRIQRHRGQRVPERLQEGDRRAAHRITRGDATTSTPASRADIAPALRTSGSRLFAAIDSTLPASR